MRFLVYFIWSAIITLIEYFLLEELIQTFSFAILYFVNLVILFFIEALFSQDLYRKYNWWDWGGGFFDQQITCICDKCVLWRKNNKKSIFINRFIISVYLMFPVVSFIILKDSSKQENERIERTHKIVENEESEIQKNITEYFDSLKIINEIPQSLNPEFKMYSIEGEILDTIIAEYSYTTNEKIEAEILDFCKGCYLWSESKSASSWLSSFDRVLNKFLLKNLEKGESVHIKLIGFSDGLPVNRYIPYKNEFGTFPKNVDGEILTSFILNGEARSIRLKEKDSIGNSEIAFLRAFSIKEYLDGYVVPLVKVKKNYAYYAFTQEDPTIKGGKYRKVKIELQIINVPKITPRIEKSKKLKTLEPLGIIITILIIPFLGKLTIYHYQAWKDEKRKGEKYKEDRNMFFVFFILTIALVFFIIKMRPAVNINIF